MSALHLGLSLSPHQDRQVRQDRQDRQALIHDQDVLWGLRPPQVRGGQSPQDLLGLCSHLHRSPAMSLMSRS